MVGTPEEECNPQPLPPSSGQRGSSTPPSPFIEDKMAVEVRLTLIWEAEAGGWPVLVQQGLDREVVTKKEYEQK